MSPPGPVPPLAPDELVSTSAERQMLETFLDLYRDILKRKLTGLSDQQIRQRHVPSATTLGGLAKHLAAVEREWFQVVPKCSTRILTRPLLGTPPGR
jgi:predicted component of type VI protein secretion system